MRGDSLRIFPEQLRNISDRDYRWSMDEWLGAAMSARRARDAGAAPGTRRKAIDRALQPRIGRFNGSKRS
jgi:hypothetical protein